MDDVQNFLKDMGQRISVQRKRLGLTQEEVAERADVSPQLISTVENGVRSIGSDKLYRISRVLNVSADYLMCGKVNEKDMFLLCEKLQNASPEQLQAIGEICDVILQLGSAQ